ncbi:hypothetical protein [Mesorhizobium sp. IMUNJ 23232]|uniref:hypothetical protein n=1 Tax=Mesorhizobium sp. IMUNJ 23232 TaxID=3376064 RepID=UPI00379AE14F
MTATTLKQTEGPPEGYPDPPAGLSTAAAALDPAMVWQRIEAYTAWRWSERAVTWIVAVEGGGGWNAPLAPVTSALTVERWQGDGWGPFTAGATPLGGFRLPNGSYRISGTVGDDESAIPAPVLEAYRRFAEYAAAKPGVPGATSETEIVQGIGTKEISRSASWVARAVQNSGAADLLRPYRRV